MEIDTISKSLETMFDVNSVPVDPEERKKELALRVKEVKDVTPEIAAKNKSLLIEDGMEMFAEMKFLSKETGSARMYEVTINLMKTLMDANSEYLKKEKETEDDQETSGSTNILITTTEDVIERILNKKNSI